MLTGLADVPHILDDDSNTASSPVLKCVSNDETPLSFESLLALKLSSTRRDAVLAVLFRYVITRVVREGSRACSLDRGLVRQFQCRCEVLV